MAFHRTLAEIDDLPGYSDAAIQALAKLTAPCPRDGTVFDVLALNEPPDLLLDAVLALELMDNGELEEFGRLANRLVVWADHGGGGAAPDLKSTRWTFLDDWFYARRSRVPVTLQNECGFLVLDAKRHAGLNDQLLGVARAVCRTRRGMQS